MISMPLHQLDTISSSAQVGATGSRRLWKVIIGAQTASAKAIFYNSADNSGTVLLTVSGAANTPIEVDLTKVGGIQFGTALYCGLSGTAAIAYVWYD